MVFVKLEEPFLKKLHLVPKKEHFGLIEFGILKEKV